jgi:23S rRNA pseudouridine1911/1915/1917 synthase
MTGEFLTRGLVYVAGEVIWMKRYEILFEDGDLLVIYKAPGVAVQSARATVPDVMSLLQNEMLERGEKGARLHLVNRLDQPVEGILLVAKNEKTAADLGRQVQDHVHMEKWYQALVCGKLAEKEGILVDYLLKDGRTNMSKVVEKGTKDAKRSELSYQVIEQWSDPDRTLLKIQLLTGRHHQIRVQLSHAGLPIVGDAKYGTMASENGQLCLCSYKTTFVHPRTKKEMTFEVSPTFPVPSRAL